MKRNLEMGLALLALLPALAGSGLAETAPVPPAPPQSAAEAVIAAQLNTKGPPAGRLSGAEADAIYKRYLDGIGKPMILTNGSNASGGLTGAQDSAGQGGGYR